MYGNKYLFTLVIWPFLAALICYLTGRKDKKLRDFCVCFSVLAEVVVYILALTSGVSDFSWSEFCGRGMYLTLDGFRTIYAGVALLMWLMTALFSAEYFESYRNRNRYYLFFLMTLGATLGVFLSADLYTTFVFFEIMSLTSYTWVAHEEKEGALRAASTYLGIAVIGGLVMLMGLFMLYDISGTLNMSELYDACVQARAIDSSNTAKLYTAGGLILFGFGAKAGMFPLHIWLPKAHPVAPAPASALLSGILTKSGVFGVIILTTQIFRYDEKFSFVVLSLGLVTMFLGAFLAVFSIDLKRTLACSSMSQIGFILTGMAFIGLLEHENVLAARGTFLHMVNHSLFKLLLFMIAGAIYMKLHRLDLNDIRGYGRNKPFLKVLFAIGGLGIAGMPLLSGYISKTLIHEAIVEYKHLTCGGLHTFIGVSEWIFLVSGGMTLAYMLKLFVAVFVDAPSEHVKAHSSEGLGCNILSAVALSVPAILIVIFGVVPGLYIERFGEMASKFMLGSELEHMAIFSLENLKGVAISIAIGLILYFAFIRTVLIKKDAKTGEPVYVNIWPEKLDLENLIYRPLLLKVLPFIFGKCIAAPVNASMDFIIKLIAKYPLRTIDENKKHPVLKRFKRNAKEAEESFQIIEASISYGMLLISIGLCFTLFYMLYLIFV